MEFCVEEQKSICRIANSFILLARQILTYQFTVSITCFLINIFHFIVLTRKPMRTSSIHFIMAAVAIADAYSMVPVIETKITTEIHKFSSCIKPESFFSAQLDIIIQSVEDFTRRCSTWLSFSIALIRCLVIRYPLNPTFEQLSRPKTAVFCIILITSISSPISVLAYFGWEVFSYEFDAIVPCRPNSTEKSYAIQMSHWFFANDALVAKEFSIFDGLISKTIPCILFPIVTVFLVIEMRKAEKIHRNVSNSTVKSGRSKSKLVLCMTITFFIAEFPLGVITTLHRFYHSGGFSEILYNATYLFTMLLSANTGTHMIICMLMSAQYRSTVKSLICCGAKKKTKKISVVSVASTA